MSTKHTQSDDEVRAQKIHDREVAAEKARAQAANQRLLEPWDPMEKPTGIGGNGPAGALGEMYRYSWNGHRIDGSLGRAPIATNDDGNPIGSLEEGQSYLRMLRLEYNGALVEVDSSQIGAPFTGCDMQAAAYLIGTGTILTPNERHVSAGASGLFGGRVQESDAWIVELQNGLTLRKIADLWWNEKKLTVGTPDAGAGGFNEDSAPTGGGGAKG